jgi:cadmium resistance protein CadD (predicted permease)
MQNPIREHLKSKTIRFGIITILVALFNMFATTEKPPGEMTWRELQQKQNQQTDKVVDLITLASGGGAIWGRSVAKGRIGGEKNEEN